MTASASDVWRQLVTRPEWMAEANCRGLDPDLFFPERDADMTDALACCNACQVRAECLAYALNRGERYGIWGGTTGRQRSRLRKRLKAS